MTTIKKTLIIGLTALTMASAGSIIVSSQAMAGGKHHSKHYSHGYNYGFNKHYRYNNYYGYSNYGYSNYGCFYKKVWRWDYYGNRYLQKIRVCR
jgi:hypothetical protein